MVRPSALDATRCDGAVRNYNTDTRSMTGRAPRTASKDANHRNRAATNTMETS